MNYSEHFFYSNNALKLYYRRYLATNSPDQKKYTLLCLPGLSRNSRDFHNFATVMQQKGYQSISLDYRGRGESQYDPNPENYNISAYVEDVRHLLIAENLEKVIIVGSSLGGIIAMHMSSSMPRNLAGVVLNDIGPEINSQWITRIIYSLEKNHSFPTWDETLLHSKQAFPLLQNLSDEQWNEQVSRNFKKDKHARFTRRWDVKVLKPMQKRLKEKDNSQWNLLSGLAKIPTLIIRGSESEVLPPQLLSKMLLHIQTKNPSCTLHSAEIPEQDHVPDPEHKNFVSAFEKFYLSITSPHAST